MVTNCLCLRSYPSMDLGNFVINEEIDAELEREEQQQQREVNFCIFLFLKVLSYSRVFHSLIYSLLSF